MYYIILHILKFIILLFHGQPGVIGRKISQIDRLFMLLHTAHGLTQFI